MLDIHHRRGRTYYHHARPDRYIPGDYEGIPVVRTRWQRVRAWLAVYFRF